MVELVETPRWEKNDGERTKARTVMGKCDKSKLVVASWDDLKARAIEGGRNREEEGRKGNSLLPP